MKPSPRVRWWTRITQEHVSYCFGLGLITLAGLGVVPNRPELYPVYAGMMGLGSVLRYARSKQRERDKEPER